MLFAIGLLPGLPKLPFLILASMLLLGWRATREAQGPEDLLEAGGESRRGGGCRGGEDPRGQRHGEGSARSGDLLASTVSRWRSAIA
jgi:hypothetical protein